MATLSNNPVVRLTDVFKTYKVGEVDVPAVKGITFSIPIIYVPVRMIMHAVAFDWLLHRPQVSKEWTTMLQIHSRLENCYD